MTSTSGATTSAGLACTATVLNVRPYTYSTVTIGVTTKPHAGVSGTENAGARSWSMTPTSAANSTGRARLYQKVSAVMNFEVVRVLVHVALDGASGNCRTEYTPPTLVARTARYHPMH